MSGAGKSLITPQKGAKPRSKNWATHGSVTTQVGGHAPLAPFFRRSFRRLFALPGTITCRKRAQDVSLGCVAHAEGAVATQETAEALRKERNRLQAEKMLQPKEPLRTDVRTLPLRVAFRQLHSPAALACGSVVFW